MNNNVVVAIDGPAGAGKSTIARRVADRLGYTYIDTGAMYRAVAVAALRAGVDLDSEALVSALARRSRVEFTSAGKVALDGEDVNEAIRAPEVSQAASRVSAFSGVREAMVEQQRRIAAGRSVVMEGRDIGSVVFPKASVKIYLDADPRIRAERRARELSETGLVVDLEEIERDICERDYRDSNRQDSPLRRVPDAICVDTTALSPDEVEAAILKAVETKVNP
ncbi:MAG TPA: (d)CMP kinase [Bryobacteraceae bacterium]|nr:(d)CMP kinase [Bryobacteraceae bacterium]